MIKKKVLVVGLGYVGINIYFHLCKKFKNVYGLEISEKKIDEIKNNIDSTGQIKNLNVIKKKNISKDFDNIKFDFIIICVPTPLLDGNPDLSLISSAFKKIKKLIYQNTIIINESTVYPGLTRKLALKYIEDKNLKLNKNYFIGFSPERISPGDKINFKKINKIVSGSNNFCLKQIKKFYSNLLDSKIIEAKSIEAAEAAKLLENCQRDVNIAMINEFNIFLKRLNIDTIETIKLASSKWNFYEVYPGLVGGQCIPIDPSYAIDIAKKNKIKLSLIEKARAINENEKLKLYKIIKNFLRNYKSSRVLFYGLSYKSNTSDHKYSKVFEVFKNIKKTHKNCFYYDKLINSVLINNKITGKIEQNSISNFDLIIIGNSIKKNEFNAIHKKFIKKNTKIINLTNFTIYNLKKNKIIYQPFV